jgi:muramoyltetrapeptide carboxypeptidase LdcA involved in peptidoglycan recycling
LVRKCGTGLMHGGYPPAMSTPPVIAPKLRPDDGLRVIAPSTSMAVLPDEQHAVSTERMADLGLRVSFGRGVRERDEFDSSSVATRVADLHEAFLDPAVHGVLTIIGGFNANQLLRAIDWELLAAHPKVFCGYSDITVLNNAMLARANLVTYSGPHYSTFAMKKGIEYTLDCFRRCLMEDGPFEVQPSPTWSDDAWFLEQENRSFRDNAGPATLRSGVAEGTAVGGNLCTLNLLHGTPWMPSLDGAILFVEDDDQAGGLGPVEFDRNLQSVLHQPDSAGIRGIVIGRFQPGSKLTIELLKRIVEGKPELASIPVACGFDFGHTTPHMTFPVGGRVRLDCSGDRPRLTVLTH